MTEEPTAGVRDIVLVVDDTPDTLGFLTDALESAGFTALVATGGNQAIALVGRITPDLVLLDAMMPDIDGFETCRHLKSGPLAHVPIIFMTALSETEHIVRGFEAGGVDYVTKPIVLDELFARLRVHLANAKAAQSTRAALDTAGSCLLATDRAGLVLWSTPHAVRLLGPGTSVGQRLPEPFVAAMLGVVDGRLVGPAILPGETIRPPLAFAYLGAMKQNELLFRLSIHDSRSDDAVLSQQFSLTAREAEVLLWVARGKANRDVGDILNLSPRTVNKHLETIFAKLGVENRASAAVLASRALDERNGA